MPFITAGDPDLDFTAAALQELVKRGSSLCELGIPYSDPIADGPVIQASYTRALEHKIKLAEILKMAGGVAPKLGAPVVTMVSYAIVYRHGLEQYVADAQKAGIAGMIVPDLLVEEAGPLAKICRAADFSLIQLVTPTTPPERAKQNRRIEHGLFVLRLGRRHHGRADRAAAGAGRQRRLAAHANAAADLHRFRHQHAGACEAAGSGCGWFDRWIGHRATHRCRCSEAEGRSAGRRGRLRRFFARCPWLSETRSSYFWFQLGATCQAY